MDIIYLIIITPITIAVMYAWHCIKQHSKHFANLPEAKPYEFERDEVIPGFNEAIKHQRTQIKKLYRGKAK